MQKRSIARRRYVAYTIPSNRHCPLGCNDMDEVINCTQCGISTTYGVSLTSRLIHNAFGLGYPVCGSCYKKEIEIGTSNL